jgi:hypothetical protein
VTEAMIRHKHKICPYVGAFGWVEQAYLKGEKVYDNGNIVGLNRGSILLSNQGGV